MENYLSQLGGGDLNELYESYAEQRRESLREAKRKERVKCPVCQRNHKPIVGEKGLSRQGVSHNAVKIYSKAQCPVCWEDTMGPPMIAMPCGHIVCPHDFELLGGKLDPSMTYASSPESSDVEGDFRQEFLNQLQGPQFMQEDDDDEDEDFELDAEDEIVEDDDLESNESMPPLEDGSADPEDSDSSGDMPVLIPRGNANESTSQRRGNRNNRSTARGRPARDENSDYLMPSFVSRDRLDDSDDDDDDDDDEDSDGSLPPLTSPLNDDDDDDDSMEMDPPAQGRPVPQPSSDNSDDSDSSLPGLLSRTVDEGTGVFLLKENNSGEVVLWRCFATHSVSQFSLTRGCQLVGMIDGRGFILIKPERGNDSTAQVHLYALGASHAYTGIKNNSACVSDGTDGLWALSTTPPSSQFSHQKELFYFGTEHPTGKLVRRVPPQTTPFAGSNGDVWLHVRQGQGDMAAGLWYLKIRGQKLVTPRLQPDAKIAPDGTGGLWVMAKSTPGERVEVFNVQRRGGDPVKRYPNVEWTRDCKLVTCADEQNAGVFIHCKRDTSWGLFFLEHSSGMLNHLCECQKQAKVVADNEGNAWILKKTGSHRAIIRVSSRGVVHECEELQPRGTTMYGFY